MFDLNNRELATVILFTVFVGVFVLVPKLRKQVASSFVGVLESFFVWKIQIPLLIYFAYATAIVYLAWWFGVWEIGQLKDSLIVVFFVGLPLLFGAQKVNDGKKLVSDVVRDAVGVSALLVFYIGTVSLPLWGELLLQPVIIFISLLTVVAQHNPEHRRVVRPLKLILGTISIGLLIYTTNVIVSEWDGTDWSDAVKSLAVSIWLPISLIPFVYAFAFIIHVENILIMLPFAIDRKQPKLAVRLAVLWGLHFSARLTSEFTGHWRGQAARAGSFRGGLRVMKDFRQAVERRASEARAYAHRLERMAGVVGVDEFGLQLDRREFCETKKELTHLYFMQMGWYRNRGGTYRPDLLELLGDMTKRGLPADHGIQLLVQGDGKAWRAWRQTPSGWFFGIAGTLTLEHQWQYDGPTPPNGFPSGKAPGWTNATLELSSQEWAKNDEPPTRV